MTLISFKATDEFKAEIKKYAKRSTRNLSNAITVAVNEWLVRQKKLEKLELDAEKGEL